MNKRRQWVFVSILLTLGAAGCSGEAATPTSSTGGASFSGGGEAGASGVPPTGIYKETLTAKADDCSQAGANGATPDAVVETTEAGFNIRLGSDGPRQDVPWQGFSAGLAHCDATLNIDVTSFSPTTLDVDITEIWNSTDACDLPATSIPAGPCSSEWLQHFELETACPAGTETVSGVTRCR
jgi:hypothetical protein